MNAYSGVQPGDSIVKREGRITLSSVHERATDTMMRSEALGTSQIKIGVVATVSVAASSLRIERCSSSWNRGDSLPSHNNARRRRRAVSKERATGWRGSARCGRAPPDHQIFRSAHGELDDDMSIPIGASGVSSSFGRSPQNSKRATRALSSSVVSKELSREAAVLKDSKSKDTTKDLFISWFRKAWPYIEGHRSSVFVIVLPGEVIADVSKINGVIQDILLLHGLGVKLVIIPGSQVQIDQLLIERGQKPLYKGAYRITDAEALAASMEAAGRIRVAMEAKLSRGPPVPTLRRHRDNIQWPEVSVASGNYLAAKRRGVVDGVDFCATGEVKRIDIRRIKEQLDNRSIVLLSNLGYTPTGEVLNCNTFEVATACAIKLQADKLLVMLDGPVLDENGRRLRFMTLKEADKLIRKRARESYAAADYVNAVAGPAYVRSLGIPTSKANAPSMNGGDRVLNGGSRALNRGSRVMDEGSTVLNGGSRALNCDSGNGNRLQCQRSQDHNLAASLSVSQGSTSGGFAIGGQERNSRSHGYLSELTAAVYACRNGVGRVQLLDSNIRGALLLELYTRDGIGLMVSSDSYEGMRRASSNDIHSIMKLIQPLEESGILVNRPQKQLVREINNYVVVERDGNVVACAALFPHLDDGCGEVAAFAVSRECQGHGVGSMLLGYVENRARALNLARLFLLTTRTADWFVQRGFLECGVEHIPGKRQDTIDFARGSKYYIKNLV